MFLCTTHAQGTPQRCPIFVILSRLRRVRFGVCDKVRPPDTSCSYDHDGHLYSEVRKSFSRFVCEESPSWPNARGRNDGLLSLSSVTNDCCSRGRQRGVFGLNTVVSSPSSDCWTLPAFLPNKALTPCQCVDKLVWKLDTERRERKRDNICGNIV